MNTNSTLKNRLSRYSAIAAGTAVAAGSAQAQVVYTDVSPDVTLSTPGTSYIINMDGTGPAEFVVFQATYSAMSADFNSISVYGSATASIAQSVYSMGTLSLTVDVAIAFGYGSQIASSAFSSSGGGGVLGAAASFTYYGYPFSLSFGNFLGTTSFAGVRFDAGGNTYYGWVRLSSSADATSVTIHDFAYMNLPDTPIDAGDMLSVSDNMLEHISVLNYNNTIDINFADVTGAKNVEVLNVIGQPVLQEQFNGSTAIIQLDDLSTGVYVVNIKHEVGNIAKKIYVR